MQQTYLNTQGGNKVQDQATAKTNFVFKGLFEVPIRGVNIEFEFVTCTDMKRKIELISS